MVKEFFSVVKKAKIGVLYINIPTQIMEEMNLKPFMCAKMKVKNGGITILNFQKTVKIKLEISKKTLADLKHIMKREGYASLDETVSNVVHRFFARDETHIVYLYPEEYLQKGFELVDDYEKSLKKRW